MCRYIDLPLQHASDAVLKRMKRPGTRATTSDSWIGSGSECPASRCVDLIVGSRRDRRRLRRAQSSSRRSSSPPGRSSRTHMRRHLSPCLVDDVPAAVKRRRQSGVMAFRSVWSAGLMGAGRTAVRCWWMAPDRARPRPAGPAGKQAPDSTRRVSHHCDRPPSPWTVY